MRLGKRILSCFLSFAVATTALTAQVYAEDDLLTDESVIDEPSTDDWKDVVEEENTAGTINHTVDEGINYIKNLSGSFWCAQYVNEYIKYLCGKYLSWESPVWLTENPSAVSGIPFSLLQGVSPQKGDILLWTNWYNGSHDGHTGVFISDCDWYDSNYSGDKQIQHHTDNYRYAVNNYWGVLRPNWNGSSTPNQLPVGSLEICETSRGRIHLAGWAYDPDKSDKSIALHVYVGSDYTKVNIQDLYSFTTDNDSIDVNNAFGISGKHRFDIWHNTNASGNLPINVYAIDADDLGATLLKPIENGAYRDSNVFYIPKNNTPIGNVDSVEGGFNKVKVSGWAKDPDEPNKIIDVHIYIGGDYPQYNTNSNDVIKKVITANISSNDVGQHRFSSEFEVPNIGSLPIFIYAIDSEGGANYKISADNAKVTVSSRINISTCTIDIPNQTYTGNVIKPSITVRNGNTVLTNGTNYEVAYPNAINVGSYTVKITGKNGYTGTKTVTFNIVKAQASLTKAPAARTGLVYNGSAQALINAGTASGGTLEYSLNGTNYSTTVPTAVNAGSYTVYYRVSGDSNHNGVGAAKLTVTIAKAAISPKVSISDWTYGSAASTPTVSGNSGGGSVSYTYSSNGTSFSSNVPSTVGSYTVKATIAETSNYLGGSATATFNIAKAQASVKAPTAKTGLVYNGSAQALINAGTASGGTLEYSLNGTNYSTTVPTAVNAGSYTVYYRVSGDSNHSGTGAAQLTVAIAKASISPKVTIADWTYGSAASTPTVSGNSGNGGVSYTYSSNGTSFSLNVPAEVGSYTVKATIAETSNYFGGSATATFKIIAKSASNFTLSAITDQTYTGSAITPAVTVNDGTKALISGTDYTVEYSNNIDLGTATVTVTGKGNYTGTKSASFKIVGKPVSNFTISAIADQTYTGSAITPAVTVKDGSKMLVSGTDYTVTYSNNTAVGTATVTIAGKGNYTGTQSVTFKIVAAAAPTPPTVTVTPGDGQVTLAWDAVNGATKYAIAIYEDGAYTVLTQKITGTSYTAKNLTNGKEYKFLVQAYNGKWSSKSTKNLVSATPVSPTPVVTATPGDGQVTFKWNAVSGATKYAVSIYENGKYTVLSKTITGTTYTAKSLTNGKEYKFLVQAYTGKWSSTSTDYLISVTPTGGTIPVVTAEAGDGQVTLKWDAVPDATKYAVSIYENGKYTVLTKTLTATTYTAKKLTNGKEYNFLVQSYTGKWSSASTDLLVSATPVSSKPTVTVTAGDGQVTLSWDAVPDATKYAVSIYENGKYTVLTKTITGTTYTAKSLTNGKEYNFLVQSYTGKWSSASTDLLISATPVSSTPVVTVIPGDEVVMLKWSAVSGATKYAVSIYENGKYTVLSKNITKTYYVAENLTNGKEYKFLVQAYNGKWSSAGTDLLVTATPEA